jgi:inositol transport system ATP-binding protein
VRAGEILGLLGENGAGKSTLLKILSGVQPPSDGRMTLGGSPYAPASPEAARAAGIVTIYQELSLIPTLSVAENIFVGRAPLGRLGLVDWRRMRRETRAIISRVDRDIDPDTPVSALSVAEQQLVEIARALSLDSRLIIMDEPTSALTEAEVRQLMGIMEALRRDGVAIMFVTHRLEEASAMCDRMTVLRDGRLAGHLVREGGPIPVPRIIERMVGRAATELYARPARREGLGAVRLSVRGLRTAGRRRAPCHRARRRRPRPRGGRDPGSRARGLGAHGARARDLRADPLAAAPSLDGSRSGRSPADGADLGIGLSPRTASSRRSSRCCPSGRTSPAASLDSSRRLGFWRGAEPRPRELPRGHVDPHGLARAGIDRAVGGQPAEGDPGPLARARPQGADRGRADARRRRRRQGRGPPDPRAAGRTWHRHPDDLVRLPEVLSVSDRIVTMRQGRVTGEMLAADATEEALMALMALDPRLRDAS